MEHEILSWDAPEYYHHHKTSDWYWILGIIALSIIVIAILFNNILFALFVLIAAITVGMYASREPNIVHFELNPHGVVTPHTFYAFDTLESFWVEDYPHHSKLLLTSKKKFMPHITIPLTGLDTNPIRDYLLDYLPEIEQHESVVHTLFENWGLY